MMLKQKLTRVFRKVFASPAGPIFGFTKMLELAILNPGALVVWVPFTVVMFSFYLFAESWDEALQRANDVVEEATD
jgi:hypothetical protein